MTVLVLAVSWLHGQDPFDFLMKLRQQNTIDKKGIKPFWWVVISGFSDEMHKTKWTTNNLIWPSQHSCNAAKLKLLWEPRSEWDLMQSLKCTSLHGIQKARDGFPHRGQDRNQKLVVKTCKLRHVSSMSISIWSGHKPFKDPSSYCMCSGAPPHFPASLQFPLPYCLPSQNTYTSFKFNHTDSLLLT